jgi:hypothetical protein
MKMDRKRLLLVAVALFGLTMGVSTGCTATGGGGGGGDADNGMDGDNGGGDNGGDNGGGNGGGDGGGNGNGGNGGGGTQEVVDSGRNAHVQSIVRVGDGFIAYRSASSGSFQVKVLDVAADMEMTLENDQLGSQNDFAMADSWVLARGNDLGLYAFDAANPGAGVMAVGDVVLGPSGQRALHGGGSIVAFGSTSGELGWVDVSSGTPEANTFARPADSAYTRWYVSGTQIAVVDGDNILIFDTATPDADPVAWPASSDFDTPIAFNGSYVVYVDADGLVNTLDAATGSTTSTGQPSTGNVAIGGGNVICGFGEASFSNTFEGFIGEGGSGDVTLAPDQDLGNRTSAGWGNVCAVSDDGMFVFASGFEEPTNTQTDQLAVWTNGGGPSDEFGGDFVPSLDGRVSAGNVSIGNGLAAFLLHTGTAAEANLGYIELP